MTVPDDYLVFDVETSGLGSDIHIVQLGWCGVVNRVPKTGGQIPFLLPDHADLAERAIEIHGWTREKLAAEGKDPKEVLEAFLELFAGYDTYLAHNLPFDARVLNANLKRYGFGMIVFSALPTVLDTGAFYKAYQLKNPKRPGESMWAYITRISNIRVSVKWKLDLCVEHFGLETRVGRHGAEEDCFLTHQVLEAMRERGWLEELMGVPVQ